MNGEEAAASLFGSEDSGSDLFATLGADTTPLSEDGLFPNETSSHASQADTYDFLPNTQTYPEYTTGSLSDSSTTQTHTNSEAADYNSTPHSEWSKYEKDSAVNDVPNGLENDSQAQNVNYNKYAPATSTYSAVPVPTNYTSHGAYNPLGQNNNAVATHLSYQSPEPPTLTQSYTPAPRSTFQPPLDLNSAHTSYAPHSTVNQSYSPYEPAAANVQSKYPTYDSNVTVNRASYNAYDPPISKAPSSHPQANKYNSSAYATETQSYNSLYHRVEPVPVGPNTDSYSSYTNSSAPVSTQPASSAPPAKSTIMRPKISNAYDPPFPVTAPIRKGSRPSALSTQQAYAQYQQPTERYQTYALQGLPVAPTDNRPIDSVYSHSEIESFDHSRESDRHSTETAPLQISENVQHYDHNTASQTWVNSEASYFPQQGNAPLSNSHVHVKDNAEGHINTLISPSSTPLPQSPLGDDSLESFGNYSLLNTSVDVAGLPQSSYTGQYGAKKATDPVDPYAPKVTHASTNYVPRTASPLSLYNGRPSEPPKKPFGTTIPFNPNTAGSPPFGSIPKPVSGNTASGSLYSLSNISEDNPVIPQTSQWSEAKPQELIVKTTVGLYAPSPSLIGANDPLSRTSARAPVVTFGFGGKMVTCFHGMPGLNAGFDVAFSSRTTSELKVRVLHKTLPETSLGNAETSYPGPLLADPGSTSISLVRPNQTTQTKIKKALVSSYLAGRISEIHQGLGYLSNTERRKTEDRLILMKLLKIMVDNDGRLLGTPQSEVAVRSTLVPRLEVTPIIQDAVSIQAFLKDTMSNETPISVTTLKPSALDKIEEFLLSGDRRQAYQYAVEEKLWAHAMVIASSIDKESWKEVVHDFLRTELAVKEESENTSVGHIPGSRQHQNNRESLRVAYSLFSGQGPAAVQEIAPLSLLQRGLGRFQSPLVPAVTPRTPNFAGMQAAALLPTVPAVSLTKWAETVAMIMSSSLTPEASGALTALGDQLLANNYVEAAHVCYLLSPQTSLIGGLGSPTAKFTLLGSKNPANVMKDTDALIFSEILEFALSLVPVVKGQEPFHGIPHLQAYRFVRSVMLAELGEVQLANRYCEAITASLSLVSPHTNLALLEQLQGLQQRISGVSPGDKGNSWIGGKIGKPSLDSIGGWLEGRFTKLVTGESEKADPNGIAPKGSADQPFAGPFAHYSNISSTTPSARSSPQPQAPPTTFNAPPQPQRTSSAMAASSPYSQHIHVERSSSAMDYVRQRPSISIYVPSSNSLSSSQSSPIAKISTQSHTSHPYTPNRPETDEEFETPVQSSWWGSSHEESESNTTPTAATFMKVEGSSMQPGDDGFISLMDNNAFSVGPSKPPSKVTTPKKLMDEDDDDLGLGNSKPKPKTSPESVDEPATHEVAASPPKAEPAAPASSASSGGSWLGKWWKRSESTTPAPVKASLGEESAFYYDKELKRWVNRKAGSTEAEKPATPPPPSRAQTASPGMTGAKPHPPPSSAPPTRSASAVDLSEPPKAPMRIRSNLAPPMESAPSTPTGSRMNLPAGLPGAPPPARPRSQAAKRNVRSRYVDILQDGGAA